MGTEAMRPLARETLPGSRASLASTFCVNRGDVVSASEALAFTALVTEVILAVTFDALLFIGLRVVKCLEKEALITFLTLL